MPKSYVPDTGDIVWLQFDPQAGREQAGHRSPLGFVTLSVQRKDQLNALLSTDYASEVLPI